MNAVPKYSGPQTVEGLAGWLRALVRGGTWAVGERLPPSREAQAIWGVDRNLVQSAYARLATEGYVDTRQGRGTTVKSLAPEKDLFDWPRFWWPRASLERPRRWNGFLIDPIDPRLPHINSEARTLLDIDHPGPVVLLGEAGMGKSTTLQQACKRANAVSDGVAQLISLGQGMRVSSFERILVTDSVIQRWRAGDANLLLFLDGLDEGAVLDAGILSGVITALKELPIERLTLRIACRANIWTDHHRQLLSAFANRGAVQEYELLELRQEDVRTAAGARELDGNRFIETITNRGLVQLATRPITLLALLADFADGMLQTSSLPEIFGRHLKRLVSSPDEPRRAFRTSGRLDGDQRLRLASRIAAAMILCRKSGISNDSCPQHPPDALSLAELHKLDTVQPLGLPLDLSTIDELLLTSLFAATGPGSFEFSHKSFAEFLAARYLDESGASEEQLERLVTGELGGSKRVPPELRETVAWLASMRPSVFRRLVDHEPETLLMADNSALSDEERGSLVNAYLARVEARLITWERIRAMEGQYSALRWSGMTEQLRAVFTSKDRDRSVRAVAMVIAGECELVDALEALINVALDASEPLDLRISALYAVRTFLDGCPDQSHPEVPRLRALLSAAARPGGEQELLGNALHCLWPLHLSADELFDAIEPQRRRNHYGAYASFLTASTASALDAAGVQRGLDWVLQHDDHDRGDLARFCDSIIAEGWSRLHDEAICMRVAACVLHRIARHRAALDSSRLRRNESPDDRLATDSNRRRMLISAMVVRLAHGSAAGDPGSKDRVEPWGLLYTESPILVREDLFWIVDRVYASKPEEREIWMELANLLLFHFHTDIWSDEERAAFVTELARPDRQPALFEALQPINLVSDRAESLRSAHKKSKALGRPRKKKNGASLRQIMESWLDASEKGAAWAWHRIHDMLVFGKRWDEADDDYANASRGVVGCTLWQSADSKLRDRITDAAKRFVMQIWPITPLLLDDGEWRGDYWAMFEAVCLLADQRPDWLIAREDEWWAAWGALVIAWRVHTESNESIEKSLAGWAYARAQGACLRTLDQTLRARRDKDRHESSLKRFQRFADAEILKVVETYLQQTGPTGPQQLQSLLEFITDANPARGRAVIGRYLAGDLGEERSQRLALAAAEAAIAHLDDCGWPLIWPVMKAYPAWGRQLMNRMAWPGPNAPTLIPRLRSEWLADLVVWMFIEMPLGPLPDRSDCETYSPTSDEGVSRFREQTLLALCDRAPAAARPSLEALCQRFPERWRLREQLLKLLDREIQRTVPTPTELAAMLKDSSVRLVASEEELVSALLESIRRFEDRLQRGPMPLRENLWDAPRGANPTPKDEAHLASNLRDHLEQDLGRSGLIVNCEVSFKGPQKRKGAETGARIDVLVQGRPGSALATRPFTVILEVKLDTNTGVLSSLETQLFDRYLGQTTVHHGVYLIGWTGARNRCLSIDALRAQLEQAARDLSQKSGFAKTAHVVVVDCSLGREVARPAPRRPKSSAPSQKK